MSRPDLTPGAVAHVDCGPRWARFLLAPTARRPVAHPLAELLLRVFREDVLLCPCGGRRVVLAFVTEKNIVKEIL